MLEAAVAAGLSSAGAEVLLAGVLPTPALAHLTAETGADLGVMISASHNPMPDNGIKLFSRGGHKLPDAVEAAIERTVVSGASDGVRPTGAAIGRVRSLPDAADRYARHVLSTVDQPLDGLRVVVDCAHGAAAAVAPDVYRRAGATVHAIGDQPDGWNINDGIGSTHLEPLIEAVRAQGADLGIAHDGDADRCLAVTAAGDVVDGDAILAVCALALHERGRLTGDTVVATVMSNLGFHHTMRDAGIAVQTTAVGDRYVLEALRAGGLSLGGEQSGHLVFLDHATTGDGLLTGLALLSRMRATGASLAELASVVQRLPQILVNVPVTDRLAVAESDSVAEAVNSVEEELGDTGRVLLRPSGTEQLVRVMVEAPTQEQADRAAHRLAEVVAAVR
ncbi:phosphoglucosamine mutase [Blastococcus brunescens]|uniref:Phosphoglucosamine mutase n=1 Tax=Blastococcus brunescens TaxID=1564165 RepID=A0ABZ1AYP9_9ACTN|nr:phosphoglucosamine mutase [Blastococcus sp. BMG 8361]WRL63051.1 phosphoglucosamine mutase [Blastococcus sp. BMG 8361]